MENGTPIIMNTSGYSGGCIKSVYVSGNDIYAVGYTNEGTSEIATLWKNGEPTYYPRATVASVYVSGNDVYVAGHSVEYSKYAKAMLWKNGTPIALTDGTNTAHAYSVCVSGSDVYVAGETRGDDFAATATLWKNGEQMLLKGNHYKSYAWAVYVSKGNVYVTGFESYGEYIGIVWKNGIPTGISDMSATTKPCSIFVK